MYNIQGINTEYNNKLKEHFIKMISCIFNSICFFLVYYFIFTKSSFAFLISFISMSFCFYEVLILCQLKFEKRVLNNKIQRMNSHDKKELEHIILYCKGEYIFTDNSVYLLKKDIDFKFTDIIFIYKKYNFVKFFQSKYKNVRRSLKEDQSLIVILKNGKAINISYDASKICCYQDNYSTLESLIFSKNEKILIGNTKENLKKMKDEYSLDEKKLKYFGII